MPRVLDLRESIDLLKKYRVPFVEQELVQTSTEAGDAAKRLGFPVVLKLVSRDVVHKTDVGGVVVNLSSEAEVKKAFESLVSGVKKARPGAKIAGVYVQRQLKGHELIIGGKIDPQFGKVLLVGLGGVFTEVFEDVETRLVPITPADSESMLRSLKFFKVLKGLRGKPPVNLEAVKDILLKVSSMLEREELEELDINPVMVNESGAVAVDARTVLS